MKNNPVLELAIAAQYIPADCPVCDRTIATVEEFKVARAGANPHWVHAECWEAYEVWLASAARLAQACQKIEAWLTNTCDRDGHPIAGLNIFAENMGGFTAEVMRESVYETAHSAETLADVFSSVAAALGETGE